MPEQKPGGNGADLEEAGGGLAGLFVHDFGISRCYSAVHSALWRQGAIFRSRRLIRLKLTSPIVASRMTVTNSFGLSQVYEEWRSKEPRPALADISSATTTP